MPRSHIYLFNANVNICNKTTNGNGKTVCYIIHYSMISCDSDLEITELEIESRRIFCIYVYVLNKTISSFGNISGRLARKNEEEDLLYIMYLIPNYAFVGVNSEI